MESSHGNQCILGSVPQVRRPTAQDFGVALPLYGTYPSPCLLFCSTPRVLRTGFGNIYFCRYVPRLDAPRAISNTDPKLQSVLRRTLCNRLDLHFHRDSIQRQNLWSGDAVVLDRRPMVRSWDRTLLCPSVASSPPVLQVMFTLTEFQVLYLDLVLYIRPRGA